MVKLQSIEREAGNKAEIVAFADAKTDVTDGMVIEGLPVGLEPSMGSSIITADGDIAFLKSDGTWEWVANGGGSGGTTVVPNPEGEATDVLTKVGIDDTVYSVGGESNVLILPVTTEGENKLLPNGMVGDDLAAYINQGKTVILREADHEDTFVTCDYTFAQFSDAGTIHFHRLEVNGEYGELVLLDMGWDLASTDTHGWVDRYVILGG